MALQQNLINRLSKLKSILREYDSLAIAFSGGVDSTFLLKVAIDELKDKVIAIYVDSPLQPRREKIAVKKVIRNLGAEMHILTIEGLNHPTFIENPVDRCYHCKSLIFNNIIEIAHLRGFSTIADGSNKDDSKDYRPGKKALKELDIKSPLEDSGLEKEDIRILSREYGLVTWDKDALACLATRIPFGESITPAKLLKVDLAEEFLRDSGFRNVRARYFGSKVLIEVHHDQVSQLRLSEFYNQLEKKMNAIGFNSIEIAPDGYKQGNMNPK